MTGPAPQLHASARDFYRAGPDSDALVPTSAPTQHVLEQLGPPPFRKSNFPVLGFLATFYEHVSDHASSAAPQPPTEERPPTPPPL
jgi:hypothetical protein